MRRKIQVALLVAMASLAVWLYADPVALNRWQDALTWLSGDRKEDIGIELQRLTALHEAAHTVTAKALRGNAALAVTKVYVRLGSGDNRVLGRSSVNVGVRHGNRGDALRVAAIFIAGGRGEAAFGHKEDHDTSDMEYANETLRSYRDNFPGESDIDRDYARFLDTVAATDCANAIVERNHSAIKALAEELMRQEPRMHRRAMVRHELVEFFERHPVSKPAGTCDF